jgi:hypothetical protein
MGKMLETVSNCSSSTRRARGLRTLPRFVRVMGVLVRVLEEQGRMAELTDTQLPLPD